jgi:hypothetical protein
MVPGHISLESHTGNREQLRNRRSYNCLARVEPGLAGRASYMGVEYNALQRTCVNVSRVVPNYNEPVQRCVKSPTILANQSPSGAAGGHYGVTHSAVPFGGSLASHSVPEALGEGPLGPTAAAGFWEK